MTVTMCLLLDNRICQYHAAFQIDSKAEISDYLEFIGVGLIQSCDGILYSGKKLFKFYITKRKQRRLTRSYNKTM